MRLAIISDVHGNLEALSQVLLNIDQSRVDGVVCLGDCIGYGPDPEEVVRLIRERDIPTIMGNHELGLVDESYLDWFNEPTRRSLLLTRRLLSTESLEYMKGLVSALVFHGCRFVHGFPPDSVTTYLFDVTEEQLVQTFSSIKEHLCFVGHTHVLEIIGFNGRLISREYLYRGLIPLRNKQRYIVNVGSVGQPRDGNNTAKYVIWDSHYNTIEVKFVPYDIAATVRKILDLGFPKMNATRLW